MKAVLFLACFYWTYKIKLLNNLILYVQYQIVKQNYGWMSRHFRVEKKVLQILLSYIQAGPGRKAKQGQKEISRNHVPTFFLGSDMVYGKLSIAAKIAMRAGCLPAWLLSTCLSVTRTPSLSWHTVIFSLEPTARRASASSCLGATEWQHGGAAASIS